jgi:RsiW-degrading membrane proteinase PrsW (M82 family)
LVAAPLDVGSYTWSGRQMSGPAFLLGVPGAITIAAAFACFAMWYGLYRERPWVRHVIFVSITGAMALGMLAATTRNSISVPDWIPAVGIVLALYWYLYRKRNVRQYFSRLASSKAGA